MTSIEQACQEFASQLLPCIQRHLVDCELQGRALFDETPATLLQGIDKLRIRERSMGWALGVLSAACAGDLLHARRERHGLPLMAQAFGAELHWSQSGLASLPALNPDARSGWMAAFLFGWLFSKSSPRPKMHWQADPEASALLVTMELPCKTPPAVLQLGHARASIRSGNQVGEPAMGSITLPASWFQLDELPSERRQA